MTRKKADFPKKTRGRPPKFQTPEELEEAISRYFASVEESGQTPTVPGLCLFLEFKHRNALREQAQRSAEFGEVVDWAMLHFEKDLNERLLANKNAAGPMIALVNQCGWKNPQHIKHSGDADGAPIQVNILQKAKEF